MVQHIGFIPTTFAVLQSRYITRVGRKVLGDPSLPRYFVFVAQRKGTYPAFGANDVFRYLASWHC